MPLSEILTSPAKMTLLKLLSQISHPICFRDIISLSSLAIRSTQIALEEFERLNLIKKRKYKNQVLYSLVKTPQVLEFKKYLHYEALQEISQRSNRYQLKASKLLESLQSMCELSGSIDQAKSSL